MSALQPIAIADSLRSTPESDIESGFANLTPEQERLFWSYFPGFSLTERCRVTRSWAWGLGHDITNPATQERLWVCKVCIIRTPRSKPKQLVSDGIQNALNHLYSDHGIVAPPGQTRSSREARSRRRNTRPDRSVAAMMRLNLEHPREQEIANQQIRSFEPEHFRRLLFEHIVEDNHPFSHAESKSLRAIFEYLNPSVAHRQAHLSDKTIKSRIQQAFHKHKDQVKELLRKSPGLIHLSFDGWRSPNRLSLYGVACFFRDENNRPCKLILGMPELTERHTGSNIADQLIQIIDEYGIRDKVGYFTLDNAGNNDTAMDEIGDILGFKGSERRGRCFGHTINLAAKALLFGSNVEAFEEQISGQPALNEKDHDCWRQKGPVGKLHNLVRKIHRKDPLTNHLQSLQQADPVNSTDRIYDVILDNLTRWLSQFYMMRRALLIRRHIERLQLDEKQQWEQNSRSKRTGARLKLKKPFICRTENQLSDKDWEVIEILTEILGLFEATVRLLEGDGMIRKRKRGWTGSYGNIWDVLLGFEFLLEKLEEFKVLAEGYPDGEFLRVNINLAWDKLNDYYVLLDETPIYYAAVALHPAYRWSWFDNHWSDRVEWVTRARAIVKSVWDTQYRGFVERPDPAQERGGHRASKRQRRQTNPFAAFCESHRSGSGDNDMPVLPAGVDEYQHWVSHPEKGDGEVDDPIGYWHDRREKYPTLSRMALDFLTIQPMSAECERLFSAAKQMVTPSRHALDGEMISMCQVLRSWLRAGVVKGLDPLFYSYSDELEDSKVEQMSDDELAAWTRGWLDLVEAGDDDEAPALNTP